MTVRERKLLRKQINLKLKCLANIESKENDFFNSSQIITERQHMYMTISKHFRAQDNRHRPKNLPFEVESKSLPHVNLSLLGRLYNSTNSIMKSDSLNKVLNAHSFRIATPLYTNPLWTIDTGKFMNYSAHVGTILHTPRYIEFLKNTADYAPGSKSHQLSGSDKPRGSQQSSSYTSTSIPSITSSSSSERTHSSSTISKSRISSRPNSPDLIVLNDKISSVSSSTTTSIKDISRKSSLNKVTEIRAISPNLLREEVDNFFKDRRIEKEDFDLITRYYDTVDKYHLSRPYYVIDYGNHLLKYDMVHFGEFHRIITTHQISKISNEDSEYITKVIRTYEQNNPRVLNRLPSSDSFFDNSSQHIANIDKISENVENENNESLRDESNENEDLTNQNEEVTDKDANENLMNTLKRVFPFDEVVDNYDIKIEPEGNEEMSENEQENSQENNVEGDFSELFRSLFRNSITEMNDKDVEDLRKLVTEYNNLEKDSNDSKEGEDNNYPKEENNNDTKEEDNNDPKEEEDNNDAKKKKENEDFFNNFENLFMKEREQMIDDDIVNLKKLLDNDLETYNGDRIEKFDEMLCRFDYISQLDWERVNKLISAEENRRARGSSKSSSKEDVVLDDSDENETMLAFRNLFRSSVGEIKKSDMEQIQKIIDEHQN